MPRKKRIISDSGIYHIIIRGNNKQKIFIQDMDRFFFLKKLYTNSKNRGVSIYAYCLMDNHIHLLLGNCGVILESLTKSLFGSYALYFNKKYEKIGHLFQDRFKSEPVTSEKYFKTVFNYIIKNPQKADICDYTQYKWNSYHKTINKNKLIDIDFLISIFGSVDALKIYLERENCANNCMEYDNQRKTDSECMKFIKETFKINIKKDITRIGKNQRDEILRISKNNGYSIRQLSRITGISRGIIQKA